MQTLKIHQSILVLLFQFSISPFVSGQWPQYGGISRDFRAAEESVTQTTKTGTWSIELGLGDAAPVVHQNKVFVNEAAVTDDGQESMQVRCLDPVNGFTLWKTNVDEMSYLSQDISENYPVRPLACPIAFDNQLVVVSYGGIVTCLNVQTGLIAWKHDLVREYKATPLQFGWASSPWTDGRNVIVACGGLEALAIAFNLHSGEVVWKLSPGEAAYGSISEVLLENGSKHLCYVGRDILIGFDPRSGNELWTYPLPKPQRTNAVTPIAISGGQLLVAGQGFEGSRRLALTNHEHQWSIREVWDSKYSPFYCNWLLDQSTDQVLGFGSNTLAGVDLETGQYRWRTRGWTDANFAINGNRILGIRGDGFLAESRITRDGLVVCAGSRVVNDRVWAPPVIVGNAALIRGRKTLSCVDLASLQAIDELPSGTSVDSMSAMYGEKNETVAAILDKASRNPDGFQYVDYASVIRDRSIRFGQSEYQSILTSLMKAENRSVSIQIAEDWCRLEPDSIVAFDNLVALKKQSGDTIIAEEMIAKRIVTVAVEVSVPSTTDSDSNVYLAGNAAILNSWKADGWLLNRSDDGKYRAKIQVPKGNLELKLTRGDWNSVEVRSDGRNISNRRRQIVQPTTLRLEVQAWKNDLNQ